MNSTVFSSGQKAFAVPKPDLKALIDPSSIVVIGASPDPTRIGGRPLAQMRDYGYSGSIYCINPRYREVQGFPCYPDVASLPATPDAALLSVNADAGLDEIERCAALGVKAAIVFSAGFAELGTEEGIARQDRLRDIAARTGLAIIGPNCLGVANFNSGAIASFNLFAPQSGSKRAAIVSQSGALAAAIYASASQAGFGISHVVTTGNEACLDLSDFIEYFADAPDIDVVLSYVEQVRDGPRFLAAARRLKRNGKLLVAYKVGRSAKGAEAAQSHTAALAGNDRAYREAFRAAGVIEARNVAELVDISYLHRFAAGTPVGGVGVLSVSGAACVALADEFAEGGHPLPTFDAELQKELRTLVPAYGMVANPVDMTANVVNDDATLPTLVRLVGRSDAVSAIVTCGSANVMRKPWADIARDPERPKKLLITVDTLCNAREEAEASGFAYFNDMTRAARALCAYLSNAKATAEDAHIPPSPAVLSARASLARLKEAGRTALSEVEGKALLQEIGVDAVTDRLVHSPEEAAAAVLALGEPAVLKLVSPDVLHKTEIGGVRLGVVGEAAARAAYDDILASARRLAPDARIDGISVQPYVTDGVEVLVGFTRDPVFGWMVTVGLGGVFTELLGDAETRLAPVSPQVAEEMFRKLKGFALLDGFRGAPKADVAAAAHAVALLSQFAVAAGDLMSEFEINPLLVRPKGALAADAVVVLSPEN